MPYFAKVVTAIHFNTLYECDGQTDEQTDGTATSLLGVATASNNDTFKS